MSTIDGKQFVADALGRSSVSTQATQLPVAVTAPSHTAVETTVSLHGENVVKLQRVLPLTVRVVDSSERPVADAEVRAANAAFRSGPQAEGLGLRVARSGVDGLAVLRDVAPGTWLLEVRHEDLIYSREAQGNEPGSYRGVAVFMPQEEEVTVRLVEPCVVAVEPEGGEILSCVFHSRGTAMHKPSNAGGYEALRARLERLQAAHPRASIDVSLLSYPPVDPKGIPVRATVWVAGRRPWHGTLQPVLLRDFQAPVRISLSDMSASSDFGSVMVHLVSSSGTELTGVGMRLVPADSENPLALGGESPFHVEKAVAGQLITLPAGRWRLTVASPFLQSRADALGVILVEPGSFREIRIGEDQEWTRCRLRSNADAPPSAGTFSITHIDSGTFVSDIVNDIRQGVELWVPVGRIRLEISARQLGLESSPRLLAGLVEAEVSARGSDTQQICAEVAAK